MSDSLLTLIEYDETSPTFLVWKEHPFFKALAGRPAGSLNKKTRYPKVQYQNKCYSIHRLVWELHNGELGDGMYLDHIDRNPFNNNISNLRVVTPTGNNINVGITSRNNSGFKGVSLNKKLGKWKAYLSIDGKQRHLGYFDTPEEANEVRSIKEKEIYKELV